MKHIYSMAAAALVTTAPNVRADEVPTEAPSSKFGVTATRQDGCALLFGACSGTRNTLALRIGDATARREVVYGQTEFNEQTQGGVGRVFPVTFRGQRYGAIDFSLGGAQQLQGTVRSLTKSFPLGADSVLMLGGYVGEVKATISAAASLGATVDVLNQRYAVGASYSKERSALFGGLTESIVTSFALRQQQSFLALSQSLHAGIDRAQGSLGVGYIFAQHSADRALLRNVGKELTLAGVPKGTVVTLHATTNRVFLDPIGDKGTQKLQVYADSLNARASSAAASVNVVLPQVTATQLAQLVGRETEPKTSSCLHVGVTYPLGANSSVVVGATRASTGRTSRSIALNLQF